MALKPAAARNGLSDIVNRDCASRLSGFLLPVT
jgi:hypothetical protein